MTQVPTALYVDVDQLVGRVRWRRCGRTVRWSIPGALYKADRARPPSGFLRSVLRAAANRIGQEAALLTDAAQTPARCASSAATKPVTSSMCGEWPQSANTVSTYRPPLLA